MIRSLPRQDRDRVRFLAKRQWRRRFVLVAILDIEGLGRTLCIAQRLETRWSDRHRRRLWRLPL